MSDSGFRNCIIMPGTGVPPCCAYWFSMFFKTALICGPGGPVDEFALFGLVALLVLLGLVVLDEESNSQPAPVHQFQRGCAPEELKPGGNSCFPHSQTALNDPFKHPVLRGLLRSKDKK